MKCKCILLFLLNLILCFVLLLPAIIPEWNETNHIETIAISQDKGKVDGVGKKIALTFDDGPNPMYTPELLDGLKERNVKASFFVIGKKIPGNEAILRRMKEEGHLIGNHTFSHIQLTALSQEKAYQEITKTNEMIDQITGEYPMFVRAPFGCWKKGLDSCLIMIPVMWTVDTLDWNTQNVSKIVSRAVTDIEENDIILMHDDYETSVEAALQIVDILQAEGYEFVTIEKVILE